jgi:hypothetical protein
MSRPLGLAFLLAAMLAPRIAEAGACCGEVSTLGDRLLSSEALATSLGVAFKPRFGSFDADGGFRDIPSGSTDVGASIFVDAVARVTQRLELGASLDGSINVRESGSVSAVGGGVGDVRARARVTVVDSADTRYWPGFSALIGAVVPTGVPASRATADLAVDVTGQGAGEVALGVSADKLWEEIFFARVDATVGFFVPESIGANRVQRAPRLTVTAALGPSFAWGSIGAGFSHEAEAAPLIESAEPSEVGRSKTDLALFGWFPVNRRLAFVARLRGPLPADGFGTQETAEVSASLAVRLALLEK